MYQACLSQASNPTFDVNHEAPAHHPQPVDGRCDRFQRVVHQRRRRLLSGIDLAANWQVDLSDMGFERLPGTFGINFLVSALLDLTTQATSTAPVIGWKGSLGPDPTTGGVATVLGAEDSYDVFDLSASLALGERTTLRMGVDKLFDTDPVITGARTALDPNPTTGQGTTEAGFYSILGRQLYVGVAAQF